MTVTISPAPSVCGGGEHITISTDKGSFRTTLTEIQAMAPDSPGEYEAAIIAIIKHQFLTRRAAGRTVAQARADLNGFVVRL